MLIWKIGVARVLSGTFSGALWLYMTWPLIREIARKLDKEIPGQKQKDYAHDLNRSKTGMSIEEARQILGVQAGASAEDIRKSHKALMMKLHPDQDGGSNYLASKINQARDTLLTNLKGRS
jgi:hypothetical protein